MRALSLLSLPIVLSSACEGSSESDLGEAFCDLLTAGPSESVVAGSGPTDAPEVAFEDASVEITLQADDDRFSGTVAYSADEAGSFAFGLDTDTPLELLGPDGETVVPFTAEVAGGPCGELAIRYTADLELDTYYLRFEDAEADVVRLVAEESDDDL